ncbi:MAG: Smr/MutS family protein [Bacteroidia bacterium]
MQKLKPGDKVRFVDENLEGIITSIKPNNIFGVTIEGDFEIDAIGSKLVKIAFEPIVVETDKEEKLPEKPNTNPIGLFAAYQRISENYLQLVLHNNFAKGCYFTCFEKDGDVYKLRENQYLEKGESVELFNYNLEDFNNWKPLYFQFLPFEPTTIHLLKPIAAQLDFNAKVFHGSLKYCFFLKQQAYVFKLDDLQATKTDLSKLQQKDFSEHLAQQKPNLMQKPDEVVDLHIDVLYKRGFPKTSVTIDLQMEVFEKSLQAAYTHGMKKIIFIHGVGTQLLKNKIHAYLKKQNNIVLMFDMADPLKFGAGATQVWFK